MIKSLKGDALDALGHWQITDGNYEHAYARLCNLYDQPHLAATDLMNRIYDVEVLKYSSSKGLQNLSNIANDVKRQMAALNYNTEHWDVMFITILQKKLDNESKKEWEIKRDPLNPTLDQMLTFIENRARALANLKLNVETHQEHKEQKDFRENKGNRKRFGDKQDYPYPKKKPFTQSNFEQQNKQTPKNMICAFCNGFHLSRSCNKYLANDQKGRERMLKEKGLCFNCLSSGHMAKFCLFGSCTRCKAKHNSTICPANPFVKSNNILSNKVKTEKKRARKNRS